MLMYTLSNPNCMPMSPLKILTVFIIDSCSFLFLAYIFRSSSKVSSVPMCTSLTKGSRFAQSVFPVQFSLPMVQHMQTKNNVISNGQVTTIRGVKSLCRLTLKLPSPAAGVSGSLIVTVVYNPYGRAWGK